MPKDEIIAYLKNLRDEIIQGFESYETNGKFQRTLWTHHSGGGGEISVLRGDVFEKAAVNWSGVFGDVFPGGDGQGPFFATGVSLITHMKNPFAPTVHMNLRYIETQSETWFGGGYDLTPMGFPFDEDTEHFHGIAKKTLDPFGKELYPRFHNWAKEYYYIPHRKKERGVGGIFFDHFKGENDYAMWKALGDTFLDTILPIYKRRIPFPYGEKERETQLNRRGHYAEFNLIEDRGTRFGLNSGGPPEAIFCSLPPLVSW